MSDEVPKGALAKYGSRLLTNGYRILPIERGTKRPPLSMENWRKIKSTPELLEDWLGRGPGDDLYLAGTGIDSRRTPGADLDILDQDGVDHMVAWIKENISADAPARVGLAPKILLVFRSDEPFGKIMSRNWVDEWCPDLGKDGLTKPYRVEILGAGQQFVAFAKHPDTKQPYRWVENGSPATRKRSSLPLLTQEQAQSICDEFDRYAEHDRGWEVKQGTHTISKLKGLSKAADGDVFAYDKQKIDISEDDLHRKLMLVPGYGDHDTWVQIGMALYHQYDGGDKGLELWHEWSAQADNYFDGSEVDARWPTFDAEGKHQEALTARIIVKLAKEHELKLKVETFRDVMTEINQMATMADFKEVCEKIKHVEFHVLDRMQIVNALQKQYKRMADATLAIGTARSLTKYEQPAVESPRWLEGWVYVSQDDTFYTTKKRLTLSRTAFDAAHNRHMLTKVEILEGKSVPETTAKDFALNNQQIEIVTNRMYLPGEDDLFWYDGKRFVNAYDPASVPEAAERITKRERAAVDRVRGHFQHLFGDTDDYKILIDALAWVVQNPGGRLDWSILMQGTEGDGKSFVSGLLAAALGGQNVHNLPATAVEEKFNGWAENCQVVFFEEIRLHGHNRFDVLNKIKPMITNKMVTIRRMNTDYYEVVNTATYILTTNFRDALPVNENDTRYFILFSRFQNKEAVDAFVAENPNYYTELYDALKYPAALRKWLLEHKIGTKFRPHGRAPASHAKVDMIDYAQSDDMAALRGVTAGTRHLDCCKTLLNVTTLTEKMGEAGAVAPFGRKMAALLLEAGYTKLKKVRIGKETRTYWSTKPDMFRLQDGTTNSTAIRVWMEDGGL